MEIEFINTRGYFNALPGFEVRDSIIDFGCNNGNFLRSSTDVDSFQYTGIDVDRPALLAGSLEYPKKNWIAYSRHHPVYNPTGFKKILPLLPPTLLERPSQVVSYSVFSHFDIQEWIDILHWMGEVLPTGSSAWVTFCNIQNRDCVDFFRKKRGMDVGQRPKEGFPFVYLIDDYLAWRSPANRSEHFVSFFRPGFLIQLLQESGLKVDRHFYAPEGWTQDTLKIQF
jgi:Methyltransferase domain